MRKFFKKISIVLFLLCCFNVVAVADERKDDTLKVDARCAIALDGKTGEVLFEQNAYEIVPMASTTKILTSIIGINSGELDKKFIISKNAVSVRGSKVGYNVGEEITLKELLFGLMFRSGNDAAIAIAEGLGGSVENFSVIMNQFARNFGILNSNFETPHGLDSNEHYSTAYDLAILTKIGMKYNLFREIVGSKEISKDKYNFTRDYHNINKILWKIPNANGVKTGYTGLAGKCLVSSVRYKDSDIIIVVLNCYNRWEETEKIFNFVKEEVAFQKKNEKDFV
ncbi:MAG: D-alanyl-D-alanine carboxypeptidase family protein [Clostridium sp.]|nr:D-alanyl-D-alanine carboxypeptidase family protein [Clostridium sp.]